MRVEARSGGGTPVWRPARVRARVCAGARVHAHADLYERVAQRIDRADLHRPLHERHGRLDPHLPKSTRNNNRVLPLYEQRGTLRRHPRSHPPTHPSRPSSAARARRNLPNPNPGRAHARGAECDEPAVRGATRAAAASFGRWVAARPCRRPAALAAGSTPALAAPVAALPVLAALAAQGSMRVGGKSGAGRGRGKARPSGRDRHSAESACAGSPVGIGS